MSCASDASSSNASQLLPFELLSEIMLLAVEANSRVVDLNGRLNYTTRIESVTRLSSVCSHWRNVALNVPQLWVLEYGDASGFPLSPQAQLFLDRSHPSTFSVSLHYSFMNRDWGHGSKPTIRALVTSNFRHTTKRWAYLSLTIRTKEELYDIAQLPRGGFQNLHHLHIQIDARIGENDAPLDVFADAPSLSTVFLGLDRLRQAAATFVPLPWPRLAQLSLELPAHRDVFDVVSRCPSLISLVLSIPDGPTDDDQAETTIRLEHLKNLVLRTTRKTKLAYMESYLAILDVPALQVLNLSCRVFHPDWFSDFIVPFETFHHRISSLTTFLLTRFPSNAPMTILLRMLRAMPELKELSLADFPRVQPRL
ncbi:hypothetical protein HMN09_00893700 [Mycena chlorophos]|uniref:F-box domain-containing protein n=1 Tax=Mycena chlorophos TaxID=658473 RepID=A0A8H6SQK6_MYCCL|nr:hypothetical protein HMN09_00893700 [Mycena chlorophos]